MNIGDTIKREDPGGCPTTWVIDSKEKLAYHQKLQKEGYIYEVLHTEVTDPFSDQTVRVHKAPPGECESCSA